MTWSTRFISLKVCVIFFIFDSVSFLLKFIFLFNKRHELFEKVLLPELWFLSCKEKFENSMISELELPKKLTWKPTF